MRTKVAQRCLIWFSRTRIYFVFIWNWKKNIFPTFMYKSVSSYPKSCCSQELVPKKKMSTSFKYLRIFFSLLIMNPFCVAPSACVCKSLPFICAQRAFFFINLIVVCVVANMFGKRAFFIFKFFIVHIVEAVRRRHGVSHAKGFIIKGILKSFWCFCVCVCALTTTFKKCLPISASTHIIAESWYKLYDKVETRARRHWRRPN